MGTVLQIRPALGASDAGDIRGQFRGFELAGFNAKKGATSISNDRDRSP